MQNTHTHKAYHLTSVKLFLTPDLLCKTQCLLTDIKSDVNRNELQFGSSWRLWNPDPYILIEIPNNRELARKSPAISIKLSRVHNY